MFERQLEQQHLEQGATFKPKAQDLDRMEFRWCPRGSMTLIISSLLSLAFYVVQPNYTVVLPVSKKDGSNVATGVKHGVAPSSSWFNSMCKTETGITRIRGIPKTTASFQ